MRISAVAETVHEQAPKLSFGERLEVTRGSKVLRVRRSGSNSYTLSVVKIDRKRSPAAVEQERIGNVGGFELAGLVENFLDTGRVIS
jgi:hypothetical protein